MTRARARGTLLLCVVLGCGEAGEPGGAGGAAGAGGGAAGAGGGAAVGPGLPEPPAASGWRRGFSADPGALGCEMTLEQARASKAASVTSGGSTLFVGYRQVGQNQDPVLLRFDGDRRVYCQHHETEPPDGRGYGLTWDGGPKAYVVYTIVGGGSAFDAKAKGGWIDRYGDGGASAKVTVLGEVDAAAGTLLRATFVPAKVVKDGQQKTNTLVPSDAPRVLAAGDIEVTGKSAWSPLNPDRTLMCAAPDTYPGALAGEGSPNFLARFAADLKTLTCASTAACSKVTTPCP